jgi:NhaP-type Na+/H+ or K+/H+ antiporter
MDLLLLAEITLILVLFTDVARIDRNRNRKDHDLPVRMLLIGLPLTIVAGTFFAAWLFPAFSIWQAALLAALLAPTDAALSGSGWEGDNGRTYFSFNDLLALAERQARISFN